MLYKKLLPAPAIMQKYKEIKKLIGLQDGKYNYIHYRYEPDFINHFQIKNTENSLQIMPIKILLVNILGRKEQKRYLNIYRTV